MPQKYPMFGSKMRELLNVKGITIESFAERLDVSDNFVSKIISGYAPSFHNFIKIVDILGASADYLIQDYITTLPNGTNKSDPLDVVMLKTFSALSKSQKEEVLHLVNFLNDENKNR